ncbi:MAG: YecH family metal-binding protein [Acidobacteriota bacterium]
MEEAMENVIHAHDVLHMVAESNDGIVLEELRTVLNEKYGPAVRFTNCADARFTVDELLAFLQMRGKISVENGVARLNAHNVCNH